MIVPGRTVAAAAALGLAVLATAGCGTAKPASDASSASPSTSYAPGGVSSTGLVMTQPAAAGGTAVVTGDLLNNGLTGNIVSASAPVAKSVNLKKGSATVSEIPVPTNGAKVSQSLTVSGYHIQLQGVDLAIDPDGQITLYVVTDKKQESMLQVKVKK